jgi:hypothetical protein
MEGIVLGSFYSARGTKNSNPHRFFTFQNFEGIIEYATNEFNYTRGIVCGSE